MGHPAQHQSKPHPHVRTVANVECVIVGSATGLLVAHVVGAPDAADYLLGDRCTLVWRAPDDAPAPTVPAPPDVFPEERDK